MSSLGRRTSTRCMWVLLSMLTLVPRFASGQAQPNQPDDFSLLTYDLRDLVLNVPDYPCSFGDGSMQGQGSWRGGRGAGGGFGGGGFGGGGFGGGGFSGGGRLTPAASRHKPRPTRTN